MLIFLWHEEFFKNLGAEFGKLVEISPRSVDRTNLSEVWLKINVKDLSMVPAVVSVLRVQGDYRLGVRVYGVVDTPIRATKVLNLVKSNLSKDQSISPSSVRFSVRACNRRLNLGWREQS